MYDVQIDDEPATDCLHEGGDDITLDVILTTLTGVMLNLTGERGQRPASRIMGELWEE